MYKLGNLLHWFLSNSKCRIGLFASITFILDQFSKCLVIQSLSRVSEYVVFEDCLKLVRWGNTGMMGNFLRGNNGLVVVITMIAVATLIGARQHFEGRTLLGQIGLGLTLGGLCGNLLDRLLPGRQCVIDFIYFFIKMGDNHESNFPAFNIADVAISVGLIIIVSSFWKTSALKSDER